MALLGVRVVVSQAEADGLGTGQSWPLDAAWEEGVTGPEMLAAIQHHGPGVTLRLGPILYMGLDAADVLRKVAKVGSEDERSAAVDALALEGKRKSKGVHS